MPPDSPRSKSGLPLSRCTWQLPHATMLFIRYVPRSSSALSCAAAAVATSKAVTKNRRMHPPYCCTRKILALDQRGKGRFAGALEDDAADHALELRRGARTRALARADDAQAVRDGRPERHAG